ncbi:dimethyl sulfoxide reductase anchor subunit family protein [Sulfuriflexus sp.]|uniref:dimethyl sulfoxide reductase anchor subunit family protein n=1 Tax=Sulfuriflexus sp. TaxID=2015443 RepID=UPI0028CEE895|nr:DmsC/YnfH family molybdoenzyme membrane anchor subunit [Sulfuriflexus sp.]MDT8405179.1 DmsC/YnfH family molybdoenzyme membrane anchor subunit [Sulfuriflexus sp.]
MHPAFSVIFLTTLIGVGQGLFLALYTGESYAVVELLPAQNQGFYVWGSVIAVAFLIAGLIASVFHLGHPERAWRAATCWRTSWLSREVIILPTVIGAVSVYGGLHALGWDLGIIGVETGVRGDLTLLIGLGGVLATFLLFICTAMIYACIKFLQEWASPLTVINYILLGTASGFTLATAFASYQAPDLVNFYGGWAIIITVTALVTRAASLIRNSRLRPKSSLQTAIGVRHTRIKQGSMGFMGGSFNTREYFHGASVFVFRFIKWIFLALTFVVPVILLGAGMKTDTSTFLMAAFIVQYIGLIAERWFFFAQANHPQNLYYQTVG